jgi:hypothetical protein
MNVSPEDELMILLECAEDAFPMGRVENFKWHAERPGNSDTVDLLCGFERNGWVTLHEVEDPDDGRVIMRPRLAPSGQKRIQELTDAGVEPSRAVDADDEVI